MGIVSLIAVIVAGGESQTNELGAVPRVERSYGLIPIGFEANVGQSHPSVKFLSRGSGYGLFATQRQIVLALGKPTDAAVLRMVPMGASPRSRLIGSGQLPREVNYLVGRNQDRMPTSVPSYRRATYRNLYPGIDLTLHGNQRALEYDFVVSPGADPDAIGLRFRGARKASVRPNGDLILRTQGGIVRQHKPIVYQDDAGARRIVPGEFVLRGKRVGFEVGPYDHTSPLVIDPVIEYSTYLGGAASYDSAQGMAVDGDGAAYVAGLTFAADFPATAGAFDATGHPQTVCAPGQNANFQPPPQDSCRSDAFVSKLDPTGEDLVYSTFLGGAKSDRIQDIDVDRAGAAYLTGGTDSDDFPITAGAHDNKAAGARRVMGVGLVVLRESFLTKLSPDGSKLEYSTFLGGSDAEEGMGVAVEGDETFVTGHTFSDDYPTTTKAFDRGLNTPSAPPNVCSDIFVTRVDSDGETLGYSTFVGGSRLDFGWDLDVDRMGAAYVMGESTGDDAPTTPGAFQRQGHVNSGPENADCSTPLDQLDDADPLVVKVAPDGSELEYSTYLGGRVHEHGLGIAVRRGSAYVVGHTNSPDFPTTNRAFDRQPKGTATLFDGFAAKLSPDGERLDYSTLLSGSGDDWIFEVSVDRSGSAYLVGITTSTNFPTTDNALDTTYVGPGGEFYDAFLTRLNPQGSKLLYSSYFGGAGPDVGLGVVADGAGSAYVTGVTYSPDLTVTTGAFAPVFKGPIGYSDAFVAKFAGFAPVPKLRLSVRPRRVRTGQSTSFRFRTTTGLGAQRRPVRDATIRFANRRMRTGSAGWTQTVKRFRSPGRRGAEASKSGYQPDRVSVRVRR